MIKQKPLILVVDDGPKNIKLMRAILEPAGYDVIDAANGEQAIQLAQSHAPALILLDLMMPGMDGFTVCDHLKMLESTRHIPIIVITAREDGESESRCFAIGAADYIAKPISVPVVLARVKTHLALDGQLRSLEGMFSDVMEFAPDAIILSNSRREIVRVNQRTEEMFAYRREELLGKSVEVLVPRKQADQSGHTCLRSDGTEFPADINQSPLTTPEDSLTMAVVRDVTERHRADLALAHSREQLRALVAQNEAIREGERKHLAREIHDELGQVLTALRMDLSLLDMRFGNLEPSISKKVLEMKALLDRAIRGARDVVANLRPSTLDMGLRLALENLCAEFSQHSGIACQFKTQEESLELDEDRTVVVYRIVQESLTNAMRYAGASQVTVTLGRKGNVFEVVVCDNGRGFDASLVSQRRTFGHLGMRERALALGGYVDISSAPGQGVTISITIPIPSPNATGHA